MKENWKKNAYLFLFCQAISMFGSLICFHAVSWHIAQTTQSGVRMVLFSLPCQILTFIGTLYGGVLADRHNPKIVNLLADSGTALITLAWGVFYIWGYQDFWTIIACFSVRGLLLGIQNPSIDKLLPQIVPGENLPKINSVNSVIQSFVAITAPIAGAALLVAMPVWIVFLTDVITAIIAVPLTCLVRNEHRKKNERLGYFKELKEGFCYIRQNNYIVYITMLSSLFFTMLGPSCLATIFIVKRFGGETWMLSTHEVIWSLGMMLGSLLFCIWSGFENKFVNLALASLSCGVVQILQGITGSFWVYVALTAIPGLTAPLYDVSITNLYQSRVDEAYRGRIFSVHGAVRQTMFPLGMAIFGFLCDFYDFGMLSIAGGTAIILVASVYLYKRGSCGGTKGEM